uniref:SRF-dependent transcription regulation-associated protein n=1 Tax=Syphacia muris TaxID=451379 RepID=A0A0N5AAE6_9BILA
MADEYEDVVHWLQQQSYRKLQQLAGKFSIKKNQKKVKLISLLKKVVEFPAFENINEKCVKLIVEDENENNEALADKRKKRRHSSTSKVDEGCFSPLSETISESPDIKKKKVGEVVNESRSRLKEGGNNSLNATFDVLNSKLFPDAPDVLSDVDSAVVDRTAKTTDLTWISEDESEVLPDKNTHDLTDDVSFENKVSANIRLSNNDLNKNELSSSLKKRRQLKKTLPNDCQGKKQEGVTAKLKVASLTKGIENLRNDNEDFKNKKISIVKGSEYGKLTAEFAEKHKALLKRGTNIEEDSKRLQLLHDKHEKEVPQLFKRLATPKHGKHSCSSHALRNAVDRKSSGRYDFSKALKDVSKKSFKFGVFDAGKIKDIEEAFQKTNGNAEAYEKKPDNEDSCSRSFKSRMSSRKALCSKQDNEMHHKKVIPFVDTMTMSDEQFEIAKKEGKIPSFIQRNR